MGGSEEEINPGKLNISDFTVDAVQNITLSGDNIKTVTLTITDDAIATQSDIAEGQYLSSWTHNLPQGLSLKAKQTIKDGDTQIILEIVGKPTVYTQQEVQLVITIPGSNLKSGKPLTSEINTDACINITERSIAISDIKIEVTENTTIQEASSTYELTLIFTGDTFKIENLEPGKDVTDWFNGQLKGMNAKIYDFKDNYSKLVILIYGTPSSTTGKVCLTPSIPADATSMAGAIQCPINTNAYIIVNSAT